MKFSIRALMVLTLMVAAWTLAVAKMYEAKKLESALGSAKVELVALKNQASMFTEYRYFQTPIEDCTAEHDEYLSSQAARDVALEKFREIQQRFLTIEPKDAETLSIRMVPQLRNGSELPPQAFRLWAPESRRIWLKWSPTDSPSMSPPKVEKPDELLPGPYAVALTPGDHMIKFWNRPGNNGGEIRLVLDDQLLIKLALPEARTAGLSSVGHDAQIDYAKDRPMRGFLNADVQFDQVEKHVLLWFDDTQGECDPFPMGSQL